MVPTPRLERGTPRSTIWCSNQLSYVGTGGDVAPRAGECKSPLVLAMAVFRRYALSIH